MTNEQKESFLSFLKNDVKKVDYFHHGDCEGADEQAHTIVSENFLSTIVIHPPNKPIYRAYCESDYQLEPKPYILRNHTIVDSCDTLIACPNGEEKKRSGTWSTVRYARKYNKKIIIINPDGKIEREFNAEK